MSSDRPQAISKLAGQDSAPDTDPNSVFWQSAPSVWLVDDAQGNKVAKSAWKSDTDVCESPTPRLKMAKPWQAPFSASTSFAARARNPWSWPGNHPYSQVSMYRNNSEPLDFRIKIIQKILPPRALFEITKAEHCRNSEGDFPWS